MRKEIPSSIITVLSDEIPKFESHDSIDDLFIYSDAPRDIPEGSKPNKVKAWLRKINKESSDPFKVLGKIIESYMEAPFFDTKIDTSRADLKNRLEIILKQCGLTYITGGIISDGSLASSKSLAEFIQGRDIPAIEAEFTRALFNVNSEPREAVSAACNIIESICKTYIYDEKLQVPKKQDLRSIWKVVKDDLGFNPALLEDDDLKKILVGLLSVIDGISSLRTHASSAHGAGRRIYKLTPRHARLAIHSAHTMALFVLETWDENKKLECRKTT